MKSGGTRNFIGFGFTKKSAEFRVSDKITGWIGDHTSPGQPVMQATSSYTWNLLGLFYFTSCLVVYERK